MRIRNYALAAGLAGLLSVAGWGYGQGGQMKGSQDMMHGGQGKMQQSCQELMKERKQMMSQIEQTDQDLMALVSKMEDAESTGDKVAVMEQLLARMVNSRGRMHTHMSGMMQQSMAHMAQHMKMDRDSGGHSLDDCPMMTTMKPAPSEGSGTMQENQR